MKSLLQSISPMLSQVEKTELQLKWSLIDAAYETMVPVDAKLALSKMKEKAGEN